MKKFILFLGFTLGIFINAQIFSWKNPNTPIDSAKTDSVIISKIERDIFSRDTLAILKDNKNYSLPEEKSVKNLQDKYLGNLTAKGALIRGITFGNSQGSSVKSAMDLQISGRLSDDVTLLASISDNNLPIQADGYTQSLEEFDKVYMQLNIRDRTILRAGHLDMNDGATYFAKYQRRSMGLEFLTAFGKNNSTLFNISAGVARSEFHRIRFQGIEGNQGPYRLTGKNGEIYITVLSGSEQVYIDGILMKRGENSDYIINYNTGEVTFTSFRPIYHQNYITISYNYTNRNYSRYLVTGGISHQNSRFRAGLNWFLENDNKNATLSLNLNDDDKKILANAGNNADLMYAPSGVKSDYDVNKILYKLTNGGAESHYEFSTDAAETLYQVAFTYFGDAKGDYKIKQTTNNGRVFEYVGAGLGDYSAVRKLPAPQKSQVISANAEYAIHNGRIGGDFSLSDYDANLFSAKDNGENTGYAGRVFADKKFEKNNWKAISNLEYQHIDRRFHILDRINSVEFSRDFNLDQEFSQITQDRLIFSFLNQWKNASFVNYWTNYLNEKDNYRGLKNDLDFGWFFGKFATTGKISYLDTKAVSQNTNFTRANILSEFIGKKGRWGIGGGMENNIKKINTLDIFDTTSYRWKEVFAQKKIGDSTRTALFAKAYFRDNDSVRANALVNVNHILGIMAESQLIKTENTTLSAFAHYRKFIYQDKTFTTSENQDFVIGNIVYNQKLFKNGMRLQAFYELGNGQEAQREFQYIKVTDGQGIYRWTDYNGDGVQQLDEFEIAEYTDLARYIRVYTNSISYLPSNKNKLQLAVFMNPSVVFNSQNQFLKRWNFNISLFSQNSFYKKDRVVVLNPFAREADQILKNQNLLFSAQFNPTDRSGWNGNYRYTANDNLVNANFSIEESRRNTHFLNVGYWFSKDLRADWENTLAKLSSHSQLYSSRNYQIDHFETHPKVTYKFSTALQSEIAAAVRNKTRTDGEEALKAFELSGALQWEHKKTSLRGNFSFINNKFSGNSFSIVGNQMLDGLKAGKNEVWSLYIQQALNSFISLNVNYEGRNSGERTIHIGSVQVKAAF